MDEHLLSLIHIWKDRVKATRTYLAAAANTGVMNANSELNAALTERNMTWADIQHLLTT